MAQQWEKCLNVVPTTSLVDTPVLDEICKKFAILLLPTITKELLQTTVNFKELLDKKYKGLKNSTTEEERVSKSLRE